MSQQKGLSSWVPPALTYSQRQTESQSGRVREGAGGERNRNRNKRQRDAHPGWNDPPNAVFRHAAKRTAGSLVLHRAGFHGSADLRVEAWAPHSAALAWSVAPVHLDILVSPGVFSHDEVGDAILARRLLQWSHAYGRRGRQRQGAREQQAGPAARRRGDHLPLCSDVQRTQMRARAPARAPSLLPATATQLRTIAAARPSIRHEGVGSLER